MFYSVTKFENPPQGDADWNASPWQNVPSEILENFMGAKPEHFPKTEVKVAYDAAAVYVMFRVEDRYVRAVAAEHQDAVCLDSCVEFFFTPGSDVSKGYFNFEINCGGTLLFHHQKLPRKDSIAISQSECKRIPCSHSMPRTVDPEVETPVIWTVAYAIPIALLQKYAEVVEPKSGVVWRANFYKCADNTSHPHWLTWSPVEAPKPDFHRPESFGTLRFE